jgi:hypothetical protein
MLQRRVPPNRRSAAGHKLARADKKVDALRAAAKAYQRWDRRKQKAKRERARGSGSGRNALPPPGPLAAPSDGTAGDVTRSTNAAAATTIESALVSALCKDHDAWVVYNRDGRRPECVYTEGMDLSVLDSGAQSSWLDYLTPNERA